MSKWGKWGGWYGSCSQEDCQYSIRIDDGTFNAPEFVYSGRRRAVARAFDLLGLRYAAVNAGFHVVDGKVTNKGFRMEVALPSRMWISPGNAYWPTLDVGFTEGAKLAHSHDYFRAIHPNRDFVQRRIYLDANFTPEESPDEQAALTDFRFECITRWSPCMARRDLVAKVDDEFMAEGREWRTDLQAGAQDAYFNNPTCFPTVEVRAREEPDVLVGSIVHAERVAHKTESDPELGMEWTADVRLEELLKGKTPVSPGLVFKVNLYGSSVSGKDVEVRPLARFILTGMGNLNELSNSDGSEFNIGECGLADASPSNLAAARKGVVEDFGPRF